MTERKECRLLLDYFNDSLNEKEQSLFEAHLATCKECQEELQELKLLTEDLPYSAEMVEPNEGMKDRILANIFDESDKMEENPKIVPLHSEEADNNHKENETETNKRKRMNYRWLQPLLAVSLLLSLSANAYLYLNQSDEDVTRAPADETNEIVKQVQLAVSEGYQGNGEAAMIKKNDGMALVVQANNLQPLQGNQAYQVWLIDEAGEKYRAGTFRTNTEGKGAVAYSINYKGEHKWTTIAVTLEPSPDSKQPKGEIVLASQF